jgi:Pre-toxin TG
VAFSLFLDFLPVIGTIKSAIEAITGRDLITGDELPNWARALRAAAGGYSGGARGWKLAGSGVKVVRTAATRASTTDVGGWGRSRDAVQVPQQAYGEPHGFKRNLGASRAIRGILIEKVLGETKYSGWVHVGALDRGFFSQIDFITPSASSEPRISIKTANPYTVRGYDTALSETLRGTSKIS